MAGILAFSSADYGDKRSYLAAGLVLGGALAVIFLLQRLRPVRRILSGRRIAQWSLFFVAGIGLTALHRVDPVPALDHHGEQLTCLGRVESIPQLRGRWECSTATLFCYADSTNGSWIPLDQLKVRLYTDTSAGNPRLRIGDLVRMEQGRLYAVDSIGYDRYMRRTRGISARYYAWRFVRIGTDTTLLFRIEQIRHRLGERLLHAPDTAADDASRVMQTLTTGDPSGIDPPLRAQYARSGVAHLLAVSGLHVGIIFLILNLLFGWIRLFRYGPAIVGTLVILCLCTYALFTGLSPSVVRAVVMFSLLQTGLMLSRHTNSLNILCAAAFIISIWNPYSVYHIGFQLSFAAVAGILTLCPPIARLWRPRFAVLRWLWSLTLVGLAAQIGTFPLVLYHFGQLQYAGLLLNPLVWFTVPVLIGGSLLYLAVGWEWIYEGTHRVAEWQNAAVGWTAEQTWAALSGLTLPGWACIAIYAGLIGGIVWLNRVSTAKTRSCFQPSAVSEEAPTSFPRAAK